MDDRRFDDLSRSLSGHVSRRHIVAALASILGAGFGVAASTSDVDATKPLRGRPYRSTCTADRQCRTGLLCRREKWLHRSDRNRCGCPADSVYCAGSCIVLGTDDNCLACGDTCGFGEACCADSGLGCVSMTDVESCGSCETVCDPELADTCDADSGCICGDSNGACPGDGVFCCDGGCLDTDIDPDHCGACGNECSGADACCGGACIDLDTDAQHCGDCERSCAPGEECTAGDCTQLTCTPQAPNQFCGVTATGETVEGCYAEPDDNGPGVPINSSATGTPCSSDADCASIYVDCGNPNQECLCIAGAADESSQAPYAPFSASECYMIWSAINNTCS